MAISDIKHIHNNELIRRLRNAHKNKGVWDERLLLLQEEVARRVLSCQILLVPSKHEDLPTLTSPEGEE